jgi:hypothetical protein
MKRFLVTLTAATAFITVGMGAKIEKANAAQIGIADFNSPIIEEFESFSGSLFPATPISVNGVTYTSNNGFLRFFPNTDAFLNCFGGCITTDTENGFIDAIFDTTFNRVGAFLGAFAGPNSASASFFSESDNLLGTVSFSGLPAGDEFVGFESLAGIKRVRFQDLAAQNAVLSIDRLHRENIAAVPTPALLPGLIGLGIGVIRKRKQVITQQN